MNNRTDASGLLHNAKSAEQRWRESYKKISLRDSDFNTMSGVEIDPLYGPGDTEAGDSPATDSSVVGNIGWPGQYPYTRGVHAAGYRGRLWTMRMFAGFGTPTDTNKRFKAILEAGGDGLSTAFDMPTLMGLDSDDSMSLGEVGRCGVAVDSVDDMATLYDGIDLGSTTTSMTINAPAAVIWAMFIANAESTGVDRSKLGGTLQNDILKEYQAQKEWVFPPRPSMRLVTDTIEFATKEMPNWNSISISGYHIREAGSTAAQELAFTLANGFAYLEAAQERGLSVEEFAPRLSFFFNAHIDFFEEIAKYRAARRIWARWLKERYGTTDPKSLSMRFHTQTAGVSLTAQQPEINIARTAIEALAGVLGGTQSLHTNSMDEALALPTDKAARIALRTQQIIAHETGVANVVDPLGGSWFVEALTDKLEEQAEELFGHIDSAGDGSMLEGAYRLIDEGWYQASIADSAYDFERKVNSGRRVVVGASDFTEGNEEDEVEILKISNDDEASQVRNLKQLRADRNQAAVDEALISLARAAETDTNLMPELIAAVSTKATLGEVVNTLAEVFGRHTERPFI